MTALVATPTRAQAHAWLVAGDYKALESTFSSIQSEYRSGARSDESLYKAFLALYDADAAHAACYDGWVEAYPNSYVALLARGIYHRKVGQEARGGNFIDATTNKQLRDMDVEYRRARTDLIASLRLDSRPLLSLSNEIDILANYDEKAAMRAALEQAKSIDAHNTVVRRLYLNYLTPRWGGGEKIARAFIEQSRREGLSETQMGLLEAVLLEDQAQSALEVGDRATAIREFEQARDTGADVCARCLGALLFEDKRYAEAIPVLSDGLNQDSENKELLYWRGISYFSIGSIRQAFPDLQKAADRGIIDAKNRVALMHYYGIDGFLPPDQARGMQLLHECAEEKDGGVCQMNLDLMVQFSKKQEAK